MRLPTRCSPPPAALALAACGRAQRREQADASADSAVGRGARPSWPRTPRSRASITLPSGLQYKVVRSGPAGGVQPQAAATRCKVHYEGKLLDGTVFDSSPTSAARRSSSRSAT